MKLASTYGTVQGAYYQHFSIELDYVLMRRANQEQHLVAAAGDPGIPIAWTPVDCRKEEGVFHDRVERPVHDMYCIAFSIAIRSPKYLLIGSTLLGRVRLERPENEKLPQELNIMETLLSLPMTITMPAGQKLFIIKNVYVSLLASCHPPL